MTDTFTWVPDDNPNGDFTHRVLRVKFGDGYEQTVPDGLNTLQQNWPLKFDRSAADITPIKAFLKAHPGTSFFWTPPDLGAVQGLYKCFSFNSVPRSGNQEVLSCQFEQAYAP